MAEAKRVINLCVFSEIEPLETVILKRPGAELRNLTPDMLESLLFDDIPYLENAQKEHDAFASLLENNGVEVLYLEDLVQDVLDTPSYKISILYDFLETSNIRNTNLRDVLSSHLSEYSSKALCEKLMAGVKKAN